jgi:predicted ATPase
MKIEKVTIKNFKSLRDIQIDLKGLTLITGVNSSGKSTFIQALLLLKQNENKLFLNYGDTNCVNINDSYVRLGNKKDILYEDAFKENIEISIFRYDSILLERDVKCNLIFEYETLKIVSNDYNSDKLDFNIFFDSTFQYITTDRIAPNILYTVSDEHISKNNIGIQGEYTAHYLAEKHHQKLKIEALRHEKAITNQLLENVSLWLGEISSGIKVNAKLYNELQQVNLTYAYVYGKNKTNEYSPLNVGFGLTYVLPIIVAILKAEPDDLLIIENPESHLHPAGQSKIAKLCALAVANGVQIIVESHSDHFLNAIRVATKQGILKAEDSVVYYFSKTSDSMETKVEEININANGSIDAYPKGFFDQFDDDLDALIEW